MSEPTPDTTYITAVPRDARIADLIREAWLLLAAQAAHLMTEGDDRSWRVTAGVTAEPGEMRLSLAAEGTRVYRSMSWDMLLDGRASLIAIITDMGKALRKALR